MAKQVKKYKAEDYLEHRVPDIGRTWCTHYRLYEFWGDNKYYPDEMEIRKKKNLKHRKPAKPAKMKYDIDNEKKDNNK